MSVTPRTQHIATLKLAYLHGGMARYRAGEVLGPRTLNDYELVVILEGQVVYEVGGRVYHAAPGDILLTRPGFREVYRWDPARRTRHAFLHFQFDRLPDDWPPPGAWPVFIHTPSPATSALFREILQRVFAHTEWPSRPPDRSTNRMMEALLTLLLQPAADHDGPAATPDRPDAVVRALNYMRLLIDEESRQPVSLKSLARVAGVSPKHLCRLFVQSIGQPPLRTLRLIQLQLAVVLLARSELSVQEIARRCGFEDPLYFSRCFTRVCRIAPRKARENMRRGRPPPRHPLPPDLIPRVFW